MAEAVGKKNIDQEEREKYFAEEDEYIKKKFNFVQNAAHPCKFHCF